ncbi:MAG: alpha-amylase family glycosyl hydrolase [Bacteroidales bacterium]|nr:alpha-amylase family glycosyl hydrolase [Bacteroidales bacterium]MCL2133888.1 alpha-amylase family glycosyl hydrolase [Bacteroidales bacterium]
MANKKIIIYQVFPRWFGNKVEQQVFAGTAAQNGVGKFNDFTDRALQEIANLGITHVWYTGIVRHATPEPYPEIVKGRAGSPYAVIDYYDVAHDLAEDPNRRIEEFEGLVERTHRADLKVIIDFVPNHVARNYQSLRKPAGVCDLGEDDDPAQSFSPTNDFYYLQGGLVLPQNIQPYGLPFDPAEICYVERPAKATGNDCFSTHPSVDDWYETVKLNYAGEGLWHKMLGILLFWASKKIDGFRCDMAEMAPLEFWNWVIPKVKAQYPELIFIAETYNPQTYNDYITVGQFDYLYDKVGLYDTLREVICSGRSTFDITRCWQVVENVCAHMLRFLENHDEQRIASRFFAGDPWKALPAMLVSAAMHQGPLMIYAGQETGEPAEGAAGFSGDDGRTSIFDYINVPTLQQYLKKRGIIRDNKNTESCTPAYSLEITEAYRQLLTFVRYSPTLANGEFYDLMWANVGRSGMERCYAFLRHTSEEQLLFVARFGMEQADNFTINLHIPQHALATMGLTNNCRYKLTPLFHADKDVIMDIDGELIINFTKFTYEIYCFSKK